MIIKEETSAYLFLFSLSLHLLPNLAILLADAYMYSISNGIKYITSDDFDYHAIGKSHFLPSEFCCLLF